MTLFLFLLLTASCLP